MRPTSNRGARNKVLATLLLALAIGILAAEPVSACATCFGAEDSSLTRGMNGAILTLLAIIGAVQIGFVAMFAGFVVRSRRERQGRSRLIPGGSS